MARYKVLRSFAGRDERGVGFRFSRGEVVDLEEVRDWVKAGFLEEMAAETPRGEEGEAENTMAAIRKAERAVGKRKRKEMK